MSRGLQNFLSVSAHPDLAKDLLQNPLPVDKESGALNTHALFSIHGLLFIYAVYFCHLMVRVAKGFLATDYGPSATTNRVD